MIESAVFLRRATQARTESSRDGSGADAEFKMQPAVYAQFPAPPLHARDTYATMRVHLLNFLHG